jgi:Fe-S-cluster-containing dehydrogenase component
LKSFLGDKESNMKQWYMIIDVGKCESCNNCFLACKDEHTGNEWPGYAASQEQKGPAWIRVEVKERGQYPLIDVAYLPTPCMHCSDAPCMKAAKNGAISRRADGIVLVDPEKAKGQRAVVNACPYGAMIWNEDLQIPQKCTLCSHLLDEGWEKSRCVQSCPTGALSMRHLEQHDMEVLAGAEGLQTYEPWRKTAPTVYYKNLYRFTRCFIAGSVSVQIDGREECAEGAAVTLLKGGARVAETVTDAFGDFKIDDLEEGSGSCTVEVTFKRYVPQRVEVDLATSVNVGHILL